MRETSILYVGIALWYVEHQTPIICHKAVEWLEDKAEELDKKYGTPYPCSGDFLCMREQVRHKANCPGRTEKIEKYVRDLKNA